MQKSDRVGNLPKPLDERFGKLAWILDADYTIVLLEILVELGVSERIELAS